MRESLLDLPPTYVTDRYDMHPDTPASSPPSRPLQLTMAALWLLLASLSHSAEFLSPARSAFGADGLAFGALLEVECWAED